MILVRRRLPRAVYYTATILTSNPLRTMASQPLARLENLSPLQLKKRPARKQRDATPHIDEDTFGVLALATADEYDLEAIVKALRADGLYTPRTIDGAIDCVHAVAKYQLTSEPREVFLFREGSLVTWNMDESERCNLLRFLAPFETDAYAAETVQQEAEQMSYRVHAVGESAAMLDATSGRILLASDGKTHGNLDKYTVSNAMGLSVKLGVWEAALERFIDSIAFIADDLKQGRRVHMTREQVLRKQGELFALRHVINLSSDLLDVPDFYWEREHLEHLYRQAFSHFSIAKRTRVVNEKINHCVELIELLAGHLSDKHHIRLEWMIIALIMVEVAFEMLHYAERMLR